MLSPDSRFMAALTRAADLMILNLLFLFTSIPIFTIGPSASALYAIAFRLGTRREQGVVRPYFRAFRQNFRQALPLWLLLCIAGGALIFNLYMLSGLPGGLRFLSVPFALLGIVYLLAAGYIFPLTALFGNSTLGTLKNALSLSLGHLPRSLIVAAVNLFPIFLALCVPVTFVQSGFLWLILYFSAAAYLCALILRKVFAPYLPDDAFAPDKPDETEEAEETTKTKKT